MYLLDTNVVSVASSPQLNAQLARWLEANSDALFISAITLAEIEFGIANVRRTKSKARGAHLAAWLDSIVRLYQKRILPFDPPAARLSGHLMDLARAKGISPGFADIAIAATAKVHDLVLLTRNMKDFTPLGILAHDPFRRLPD